MKMSKRKMIKMKWIKNKKKIYHTQKGRAEQAQPGSLRRRWGQDLTQIFYWIFQPWKALFSHAGALG